MSGYLFIPPNYSRLRRHFLQGLWEYPLLVKFPATTRDHTVEEPISSLSADAGLELGVTEFSNEALEVTTANEGRSSGVTVLPDNQYQDIKEYFARPRLVTKFNAATTRSNLYNFDVFDWVQNFWPTAAVNRLNGVFAYRAKARLTLTLAATPFQQGLVTVGFQYEGNSAGFTLNRGTFPPLSTNVPHARLNFADTTIAELDIPFIYPYDYIEFANGTAGGGDNYRPPYGNISVVQQLPYVVVPGSTAPRLSLYVSLTDMVLFGAVPVSLNAVIPQSGLSEMNKEAKKTKIVSRGLSGISSAAGTASKFAMALGMPGAAAMSHGVSWMSDKLAKTAKSFGYSKPIIEDQTLRTEIVVSGSATNIDVPDTAVPISPFITNRLDVTEADGSTVDQMAMDFVLRQWCQCFVGTMSTSYTDGTFIYASRCSPTNFWFRTNSGTPGGNLALPVSSTLTTNCIAPTALCYFGNMFRVFRGGLRFRFTFAKTKFHAGRLVASFVPSTEEFGDTGISSSICPLPEVTASVGLQPFTSSAIFDLKDDSVFEFEVPYVCTRPHISTGGSFGGISLAVLDPLRTTGETSDTISFLVEVCAADDFEFSNFVGGTLAPAVGNSINARCVVLQSGLDSMKTLNDKPLEVVHQTMGEKVTSLKELIMSPSYTQSTCASNENLTAVLPNWAYYPNLPVVTPPFNNTTFVRYVCSPQNMIASCYAFVSGGTTYHVYSDSPAARFVIRQAGTDNNTTPATISDPRFRGPSIQPRHYSAGNTVVSLHAKCPSYQKAKLVPRDQMGFYSANFDPRVGNLIKNDRFSSSIYQLLTAYKASTGSMLFYVGYAGSDDARGHHYIGPPLVFIPASTSTASLNESAVGL